MVDLHLKLIIRRVESMRADGSSIAIPLTLFVNGAVVEGELITEDEFFHSHEGVVGEFFSAITDGIDEAAVATDKPLTEVKDHLEEYIHLKDVRILSTSGGETSNSLQLWRAKLDSVDGFAFSRS